MSDPLEAISDLACIKEIIDGLTQDSKNELFKHFVTSLNNLANKVTNRPDYSGSNEFWTWVFCF